MASTIVWGLSHLQESVNTRNIEKMHVPRIGGVDGERP